MRKFLVSSLIFVSVIGSNSLAAERLSLGYIYSASKSHSEIIEVTNNSINVVSPTCFDLTVKGRLVVNDEILDKSFIEKMHEEGVKVTPFLSNHWGRKRAQAALEKPEILVKDLVEAMELYDLDGVNVDLENLTVKDKDKLTKFVKLLREALPNEKTVSVAVAANPEKLTSTWLASYDYKELAKYADYLVLMSYDEHSYGGSEGPVASITFVEKSLNVILEEVSRDKIVMGIPLYGRFWKEGESVGGEAIVIGQVPRILKQYNVVPRYDETLQTPYVELTIEEGEKGPFVNGTYLEEGTYKIWYENENSIKAKLELVNKYDILGTGLWALDNEGADFWDYYKEALNSVPYESEEEIELKEKAKIIKRLEIEIGVGRDCNILKEVEKSNFKGINIIALNENMTKSLSQDKYVLLPGKVEIKRQKYSA